MRQALIFLMLVSGCLAASTTEYYIKSFGMKIAYIAICKDAAKGTIEIKTHSLNTNRIFPQIDNIYRISYDEMLRPIVSKRVIKQKNIDDFVITEYDHNSNSATLTRGSDKRKSKFAIDKNSREIFSFLELIKSGRAGDGSYPIDGNGLPWQATVSKKEKESVSTTIGKFSAQRYDITFENLSGTKMPYVDMVTHNTLNENNKMSLWVNDQQLAVRAVSKKGGISATWELIRFTP